MTLHRQAIVNAAGGVAGYFFELLLLVVPEPDFFFLLEPDDFALDPERAADFFAVERLVVVEPLELALAGADSGGDGGVAVGALAAAARVRPPATATSG